MRDSTEAASELVNLRANLEKKNSTIREEKDGILATINTIRAQKGELRRKIGEEMRRFYKLKLELINIDQQVNFHANHVDKNREKLSGLQKNIFNQIKLASFEERVNQLRDTIQSAINFYSEDSLALELLERNNSLRDQRVELTRLTSTCEELRQKIEAQRMEKERARKEAQEKARLEEERKKRIEEETARAELERKRQEFLQKRDAPVGDQSFRNLAFSGRSPEPSTVGKSNYTFPSIERRVEDTSENYTPDQERLFKPIIGQATFSQMFDWTK